MRLTRSFTGEFRWGCSKLVMKQLESWVFFNEIIEITTQTLVLLLLAGYIAIEKPKFERWGDHFNYTFALFGLACSLVIIPGILFHLRKKRKGTLNTHYYTRSFGMLTVDLTIERGRYILHWIVRFMRVIGFLCVAVFAKNQSGLQLVLLFFVTILFQILTMKTQAAEQRLHRRLEIVNEVLLAIATFSTVFFAGYDLETRT